MATPTAPQRFVSPYDDPAPEGAEGWEDMYPYYLRFREDRREMEEGRFWFADLSHWPTVFKPFDTITVEFAIRCLGQYNTRHYIIPPANGIDYRVHNGYVYMSPVAVAPELIEGRVPEFLERAGHYFANWDELLANWQRKVDGVIAGLQAIHFAPLPDRVDLARIQDGTGLDPHYAMTRDYNRLVELAYQAFQYHFEFLNLGYVAYLDFFGFCQEAFPGISDLGIAKMVQGIDVDLFRPDDELRELARRAVALDVDAGLAGGGPAAPRLSALAERPGGPEWLAAWDAVREEWFDFSSGSGMYSTDRVWAEHLEIPLDFVADYADRVRSGQDIERPRAAIGAERDRVTDEYRSLLPDDDARAAFDEKLGLARTVFPYVENHNLYIEHKSLSVFWRKVRELGGVFAQAGFLADAEDIFLLRRDEIPTALFDLGNGWAVGADTAGQLHWPPILERRREMLAALAAKAPAPAMNQPPEVVTEPFTIMLYGITTDSVNGWLAGREEGEDLTGMAASAGTVEGTARVVLDAAELSQIEEGDVIVARITAPSWGPVFAKAGAVVTDIGGMMSHAAIVCREYGLPAVTGTGSATTAIRTGSRVRVDGSSGRVTLLEP